MNLLFLFLDGLGLGPDEPGINPLARTLRAIDACLGVPGLPQSATGQAVLLAGVNVPAAIGEHYGPKPDGRVRAFLQETLFSKVIRAGMRAALLNAYPERYFQGVNSGRRLYSAIPQAAVNAGLSLFTKDDLYAGRALPPAPGPPPPEAGIRLASLAGEVHFSMFEYWPSDYAGHGREMAPAVKILEEFDGVLGGLLEAWDDARGLVVVSSDHGNLEDLGTRKHTLNPVPALVIGALAERENFLPGLRDLTGIAPGIMRAIIPQQSRAS
jgi:2,3-bisphosphoglycerate-independent phosphoglycerate mutase